MRIQITDEQMRQIRTLTRQGKRQSHIAQALGLTASAVRRWQIRQGLTTRLVTDEKKVAELYAKGWTVQKIAGRFSRSISAIDKILRKQRRERAAKHRAKNEQAFTVACRRRKRSVRELAIRFGVNIEKAYRIAHTIFPGKFRRGPVKAADLPMTMVTPAPAPAPFAEPDVAVNAVVAFLNRYTGGQLVEADEDAGLVATFLQHVPVDLPDPVKSVVAFNLARAIHVLRKSAAGAWVH